jgi:hypothetical protein
MQAAISIARSSVVGLMGLPDLAKMSSGSGVNRRIRCACLRVRVAGRQTSPGKVIDRLSANEMPRNISSRGTGRASARFKLGSDADFERPQAVKKWVARQADRSERCHYWRTRHRFGYDDTLRLLERCPCIL